MSTLTENTQSSDSPASNKGDTILELKNLSTLFPIYGGLLRTVQNHVKAVVDVNLSVKRGKTLGLVGESGCGKSTLGKSILGLYPQTTGEVIYYDKNGQPHSLLGMAPNELKQFRKKIQIIFQDPYSSLNPKLKVSDIIKEGMVIHGLNSGRLDLAVVELLDQVGLPKNAGEKYPHEFSGGQRQRIGIARALAVEPEFIICDEAVSALDVSIQAQIINLLMDLQSRLNLSYLFISHDLSVIQHISNEVAVMYLGQLVEQGPRNNLFNEPAHPYTQALLSSVPGFNGERIILEGDVPSPINPPSGCSFHTRCRVKKDGCTSWSRQQTLVGTGREHWVACLNYES